MPVSRIIPPHAVDRPELLARLDVGRTAPLTLVVAPAGSGKSVLLTQWAATLGDAGVACARNAFKKGEIRKMPKAHKATAPRTKRIRFIG